MVAETDIPNATAPAGRGRLSDREEAPLDQTHHRMGGLMKVLLRPFEGVLVTLAVGGGHWEWPRWRRSALRTSRRGSQASSPNGPGRSTMLAGPSTARATDPPPPLRTTRAWPIPAVSPHANCARQHCSCRSDERWATARTPARLGSDASPAHLCWPHSRVTLAHAQAGARARLRAVPGDDETLFLLGKLDLNYVWLQLGTLGHKTGWAEYLEAETIARHGVDPSTGPRPRPRRARLD